MFQEPFEEENKQSDLDCIPQASLELPSTIYSQHGTYSLPLGERWQSIRSGLKVTSLRKSGCLAKTAQSSGRPLQVIKDLTAAFFCDQPCLIKTIFCSGFYMYKRILSSRYSLIQQQKNRSMSVTISNCNQICNAPTNLSGSKMLYSFPKQGRFLKRKTILCDKYYEIKNTLSRRAPALGYGNKYDFTKELPNCPPPNSYHFSDSFSPSPKKGFSFGQSRDKMMVTGPLVGTIHNKNPGPGNYEYKGTRSTINYSLSAKIEHPNKEQMGIPGPGKYTTPFTLNKDGKYFHARYKNSCVRDFGRVLGRCKTAENKLPGPGAYDVAAHQDISPKGRYCLSNSQNCLARSFGSSMRGDVSLNRQTPGPGNYRIPSEFGYYASKKSQQDGNKQNLNRSLELDPKDTE